MLMSMKPVIRVSKERPFPEWRTEVAQAQEKEGQDGRRPSWGTHTQMCVPSQTYRDPKLLASFSEEYIIFLI